MARITVEDCIDKFPSRFELVLVASNRARKLYSGDDPTVDKDNDKNTVIALREIAQETLSKDKLQNDLIEEYQTTSFVDDEELLIQQDEKDNQLSISSDEDNQEISTEESQNNIDNQINLSDKPKEEDLENNHSDEVQLEDENKNLSEQ